MNSTRSILLFLAGIALLIVTHFIIDLSDHGKRPVNHRNTLTTIDIENVTQITIARCGEAPTRLKRIDYGWRIVSPFSAAADEKAVKKLLDALRYTSILETMSEKELISIGGDRSDFSLSPPITAVTLSDGEKEETISINAPTPTADGVFAEVSNVEAVFTIPHTILAASDIPAEGFRRRSLFSADPSAIVSFSIRRGKGAAITFTNGENGWGTENAIVSSAKVKTFLSNLTSAEAKEFVWPIGATNEAQSASEALLAAYDLDPESALTVTLKDAAGFESQVSFGKAAGEGLAYARVQNGTAVVTIPAALKESLIDGPSAFGDSRLFQIDMRDITAFTISDGAISHALTRTADSIWVLESPIAANADKTVVEQILAHILALTSADLDDNGVSVSLTPGTKRFSVSRASVLGKARFEDLRSLEALRIDPTLVRRIVRTTLENTSSAVYIRDRRTWVVESPLNDSTIDNDAIQSILAAINPLSAEKIEKLKASEADMATYGLDNPALTISFDQDREDTLRRNLIIGEKSPAGGRYATVGSSDAVFIIAEDIFKKISSPLFK
jgi:hypothetical protein